MSTDGVMAVDPVRAALVELLVAHTEAAGFKVSMVYDKQQFTEFLDRSQKRVDAAVAQAQAALADGVKACALTEPKGGA